MKEEIDDDKNNKEELIINDTQKEEREYNNIDNKNSQINDNEPLIEGKIEQKEKHRYFGIDLIRVVACYLVLLTHAGETFYMGNGFVALIKSDKNIWAGVLILYLEHVFLYLL